jgi:hypothetical protein
MAAGERTVSRRRFLLGAGALAGGLALARADGVALAAPQVASGLSARRARVYRRLVVALQAAPDRRWRRHDVDGATRAFARWYARQPAATREHVDVVLDRLAADGAPRYRTLAAAAGADDPGRSALMAAAVALGATSCDPPLEDDERPPVAAPVLP